MIGRIAAVLAIGLACFVHPVVANQDALSKVRELYLSADYENALAMLDRLGNGGSVSDPEAADYRVFCLLALDRGEEARQAIKAILEADPFHRLSEAQASPRMLTAFQEARKALLPDLVHRMYADAKALFDKQDPAAAGRFDRLMTLLDDPDLKDAQLSDLRAVAAGFRDLSRAAAKPPADAAAKPAPVDVAPDVASAPSEPAPGTATPPPPPPVTSAPRPASPLTGPADKIRVTTRGASPLFTPKDPPPPGLELPLAISQPIPGWSRRGAAAHQNFDGVIEVTIDELGNVTTVAVLQATLPSFDEALVKAARTWKFKPALLHGTPVRFVKVIEIQIQPEP
jgi:TonB family protein